MTTTTPQAQAQTENTDRQVMMSRKYWDEYSEIAFSKKVTQATAEYNPLGGTDERACVNCQFFISPQACSIVEGYPMPIAPTGLSRFWTAVEQYEMEPMRVVIVEEGEAGYSVEEEEEAEKQRKDSFWESFKSLASSLFGVPTPVAVVPEVKEWEDIPIDEKSLTGFKVFQDNAGTTRWLAWVSNNFKDREGEIFEDAAHREFVEFLDNGGQMPEAWLWHTPGTRWGQADFADYDDGFLIMSGVVDDTDEARSVAKSLAAESDTLGVSHGFYFRYSEKDASTISWYRSFEISPLPLVAAANAWTGLQVIREAKEMNAAKQAWLEEKLGKERAAQVINDRSEISKALTELGIDSKGMPGDDVSIPSVAEIAGAAAKAITDSPEWASLFGTVTAVKSTADATTEKLTALETRIKALEQSDDEKVAAALMGNRNRSAQPQTGYRASQVDGTALGTDPTDAALKESKPMSLVDGGFAKSLY